MARRINTRFLIIASSVVLVLGLLGGGAVAYKLMARKNPQPFIEGGHKYFAQANWEQAAAHFYRATQLKKTPDAELYMLLGDCFFNMTAQDMENLRRAIASYQQVLLLQPDHSQALHRLLKIARDESELFPSAMAFDALVEAANRVLAQYPQDVEARKAVAMAPLLRWFAGLEVDPRSVQEGIEQLQAIHEQHPSDVEVMFNLGRARLALAQRERPRDRQASDQQLDLIEKTIDATLKASPDSGAAHFRAWQLLNDVYVVRGQARQQQAELQALLDQAGELITPQDDLYTEVRGTVARRLELSDPAAAEAMLRQLLEQRPDDQFVRVMLADLLGRQPERRQEALELLEQPLLISAGWTGVRGDLSRRSELHTLIRRIELRLDMVGASTDPEVRRELLTRIDQDYDRLSTRAGENAGVLQLRGRIELAKERTIDAIQTLNRALAMMPVADRENRLRVKYMLARANLALQQTGAARRELTDIIEIAPQFTQGRLMLAELLLREGERQASLDHLRVVQQMEPNNPLVARLMLEALDPQRDQASIDRIFAELPEQTDQQVLEKAQTAIRLGRNAQAVELLERVRSQHQGNASIAIGLANLYIAQDQRDKARQVIAEARQANPANRQLELAEKQLDQVSPQELQQWVEGAIADITDPYHKEMAMAQLAREQGREDDAFNHFVAALKIRPDDGVVMDQLFQLHLQRQEWGKAEYYLNELTRKNQDQAHGLLYRVRYLLARGELEQARQSAVELTRRLPEFSQSWLVLGQVQQRSHQYAEAISSYQLALEKRAQDLDALRGLVECNLQLDRPLEARRAIDRARRLAPNNVLFREMELAWELQYGDPEKVIGPRSAELKQNPDDPRRWITLGMVYLQASRARGTTPTKAQEYIQRARETLSGAQSKWPGDIQIVGLLADVNMMLNRPADAQAILMQLAAQPEWKDRVEPVAMLAEFYARTGQIEQAEQTLRSYLSRPDALPTMKVRLANLLSNVGRLDDALAALDGDDPEVIRHRIELQINTGRLAEAEQSLERALSSDPRNPTLRTLQAFVDLNSNRVEQASRRLDDVITSHPQHVAALYYRGILRLQTGRNISGAIADLAQVRNLAPANIDARILLAQAHRTAGALDHAIRELEQAIADFPTDKRLRLTLIDYYGSASPPRWGQAERMIRELRANPQFANDPDLINAEGVIAQARNDHETAARYFAEALTHAPQNPAIHRNHLNALLRARKYREVLSESDKLLQAGLNAWWVHQVRGVAKRYSNDREGAMNELEQALSLAQGDEVASQAIVQTIAAELSVDRALERVLPRAENDNRWRFTAAFLYQSKGDIPAAIDMIERILQEFSSLTPTQQENVLRLAGNLYLMDSPRRNVQRSIDMYRRLLERNPDDWPSLNNLAFMLVSPGVTPQPAEALKYSQRAYDLTRELGVVEPYVLDTHGHILVLNNRLDEGMNLLREAIQRRRFPEAHYHLGLAYIKKGQAAEALNELQAARELIEAAERERQPVDVSVKLGIEEAINQARRLMDNPQAGAG